MRYEFAVFVSLCTWIGTTWADGNDLAKWKPDPENWKGATVADGKATLTSDKWSFLRTTEEYEHGEWSAKVTIEEPAKQFRFFGDGWSAWPDPIFGDGGFEAGLLLRAGKTDGYRVQFSHKYQCVALVKYPDGGYLRVVPFAVKTKEAHLVQVDINAAQIVVTVDGKPVIRMYDSFLPLGKGTIGIGVSSLAKVQFREVSFTPSPKRIPQLELPPHVAKFTSRKFLGDRMWIFDGDEPILQLHSEKDPSCFAKLRPGYKPQLTFDSHWGIENQGAFPEGAARWTEPTVVGSGNSLKVTWSARNVKDRFTTRSSMSIGFDRQRSTYTYDIDSELEVLKGEPFHFRYGFDFEHHTPLDPFRWQYLVAKRRGGELYHRPVYPIDPGPQNDLETYHGTRVWYGRHQETMRIAPAVEYAIEPEWNRDPKNLDKVLDRKMNTAVCAAFYDTGVSFAPETAPPGTKIRVKYRYTGYPAHEAEAMFKDSKIYSSPTLDPQHHYLFADEWPKLTFRQYEPMSKSWIYGRTPFMTAHNTRPTYELVKDCGIGSGHAMRLGPASFGKARWPMPGPLAPGRYLLTAMVKSTNTHGPGGRMELEAIQAKTNQKLAEARHFVGNGTFDWKRVGFVFEVPQEAGGLNIAFGNVGTGEMQITEVEFRKWEDGQELPSGVQRKPNDQPPAFPKAPEDAIADFRMQEGKGFHVLNYAGGDHLHLANLDWVKDSGRPALRFADNTTGRKAYRSDSPLSQHYFQHAAYSDKDTLPLALSGTHGGGEVLKGLTIAAWIKPAAEMGKSTHGGKGDIAGYGARRFILSLHGQKAPYQLAGRINVNDSVVAETKLEADRWYHVAMTAAPMDGQWQVRLWVDGKQVAEGMTKKFPSHSIVPHSIVLGAELFYFHDAYYRGLIGPTLIFRRALTADEIAKFAKE